MSEALSTAPSRSGAKMDTLAANYQLPPDFTAFMRADNLDSLVPSSTACYFFLGWPFKLHDDCTLVLFYRDQQDCLGWYLVLDGPSQGQIIASVYIIGTNEDEGKDLPVSETEDFLRRSVQCADSFGEFLYRLWVENHIWFRSSDGFSVNGDPDIVERECSWYLEECRKLSN
ncbi:hypothetical protein HDU83_008588 [Entophlyctis luteolus]|nr:hypothetical protein HDU83_008588 [Entophlyctis luteolus]